MTTRLVFVDDSKQKGNRDGMGNLISLGAVAFDAAEVQPWAKAVTDGLVELGCPPKEEIKWSVERGNFYRSEDGRDKLTSVRELLLSEAARANVTAFAVVWDDGRTTLKDKAVGGHVFKWLWERVNMMVQNLEDHAVLIFDKPSGDHKDEARWISEHSILNETGTEYVQPGSLCLAPLTAPSHLHLPLQLADLIAGALTAAVSGNKYALDLMPMIKPLLHVGSYGTQGGSGLKLYPDALANLYTVLLGETGIVRGGRHGNLPHPPWPYYEDAKASLRS